MKSLRNRTSRTGLTVVEMLITLSLLTVVVIRVSIVINEAQRVNTTQSARMALQDQAHRLLDRIVTSIMPCAPDNVSPSAETPAHSSLVRYRVTLGVEHGVEVLGPEEEIQLNEVEQKLYWIEDPDSPNPKKIAWCTVVRPLFDGEILNGVDDNTNSLADESGLSFEREAGTSTFSVRLTLEKRLSDGQSITVPVEARVTCRNS